MTNFRLPFLAPLMAVALAATACGLLHEKEAATPVAHVSAGLGGCAFPELADLTRSDRVTEAIVTGAIDCAESQLDTGFKSVHGQIAGELSLDELRELHSRGVINLPLHGEDDWTAAAGGFSLFHPEGRAAISQATVRDLVAWARRSTSLYVRLVKYVPSSTNFDWGFHTALIDMAEGFFALWSSRGHMTLAQAQAAVIGSDAREVRPGRRSDPLDLRAKVEAIWKLKAAFLEDPEQLGDRSDLTGASLKKVAALGVRLARGARHTLGWLETGTKPQDVPSELPAEWRDLAAIAKAYFTDSAFTPIDTDQLRWATQKLDPQGGLSELTPDLIRIGQRLAPPDRHYSGLHPIGFASLLDQFEPIARDLVAGAQPFGRCANDIDCSVTLRSVYKDHPILKRVALKGALEWPSQSQPVTPGAPLPPLPKRLDLPLRWSVAAGRLIERGMLSRIFSAFDRNHDGLVPLEGNTSEDTKEAMDLAYTFLRFASASRKGDAGTDHDGAQADEHVSNPILVKPSALYRTIGLIGDRWMPDGNGDGALDAEEFFSVVKVYGDIQANAQSSAWALYELPQFTTDPQTPVWELPGGAIYSRHAFIHRLHEGYRYFMPQMYEILNGLGEETRESFFHALIGVPDAPLEVYPISYSDPAHPAPPPARQTLRQYARADAALAPAAIVSLFDRLMVRCDADEDGLLSWTELDCAMPLILSAGLQTVSSELVDLDPIVHDGSKLLLGLLSTPGVPATIAKMVAINGSVRKLQLSDAFQAWIDRGLEADWSNLAFLIGAPESDPLLPDQGRAWLIEARRRYGACDLDHDGKLKGAELDCFVDRVLDQLDGLIARAGSQFLTGNMAQELARALRESPVVRAGIKLATQPPERIEAALHALPANSSSPEKLLRIIEESIRRSVPLCQLPDC